MNKYFFGWNYRCQYDTQTHAIIPSVHKTTDGAFRNIQIVTDTDAFLNSSSYFDPSRNGSEICIGMNRFVSDGITLNIHNPNCRHPTICCSGHSRQSNTTSWALFAIFHFFSTDTAFAA